MSCPQTPTTTFSLCISVSNPLLAAAEEISLADTPLPNVLLSGQEWQLPAAFGGAQVSVYNLSGRVVYKEQSHAGNQNAILLSRGLYLYRIMLPASGKMLSGRLLVR